MSRWGRVFDLRLALAMSLMFGGIGFLFINGFEWVALPFWAGGAFFLGKALRTPHDAAPRAARGPEVVMEFDGKLTRDKPFRLHNDSDVVAYNVQIDPVDGGNIAATFDIIPKLVKDSPVEILPRIAAPGARGVTASHDMREFLGDEQQFISAKWSRAMDDAKANRYRSSFFGSVNFAVTIRYEDFNGKKYVTRCTLEYIGLQQEVRMRKR